MKIAIINPGGITNFGERAIMLGTVYELRERYPKAEIKIFGYKDLEMEDPRLHLELTKLGVTFTEPIILGASKVSRVLHAGGLLISPRLFLSKGSYEYLKNAAVYSKGQESFTQDYGMTHFVDSFLEQLIVSRMNRDITLLGHSVGPVYKFKRATRIVINRFKAIHVRDSRSEKVLRDELYYPPEKVVLRKDLAYRAVADYDLGTSPKEKSHYLIVPNAAICHTSTESEQYMANLRILINTLLDRGSKIIVGSSVTSGDWNNDYDICEKLAAEFSAIEIKHYKTLDEFLIDVRDAKKVISSRLHPLIMATGLSTEVLAMSKSHKIKGLLGDLKLQSSIIDPFASVEPVTQLKGL